MQPIQALEQGMSALTLSSQTNQGSSQACKDIASATGFPLSILDKVFEYASIQPPLRQPLQQEPGANSFNATLYIDDERDVSETIYDPDTGFEKSGIGRYLQRIFVDTVQLKLHKLELTVEKIVKIVQQIDTALLKGRSIDLNISAWFEKNKDRETELCEQLSQLHGNPGELFFYQDQTYIRCISLRGKEEQELYISWLRNTKKNSHKNFKERALHPSTERDIGELEEESRLPPDDRQYQRFLRGIDYMQ